MDDQKSQLKQAAPTPEVTRRKGSFAPVLTIYGNLQAMTTTVGTHGVKDGASGTKNVRSQP
jgi:hypothetical protein